MGSGKGKAKRVNASSIPYPRDYGEPRIDDYARSVYGNRIISLTPELKIDKIKQTAVITFAHVTDSNNVDYKKREAAIEIVDGIPQVLFRKNSGIPLTRLIEIFDEVEKESFIPEDKRWDSFKDDEYEYTKEDMFLGREPKKKPKPSSIIIETESGDVTVAKEKVSEITTYGTSYPYRGHYPVKEEIIIDDGTERYNPLLRIRLGRQSDDFKKLLLEAKTEFNRFNWKNKTANYDKGIFKKDS